MTENILFKMSQTKFILNIYKSPSVLYHIQVFFTTFSGSKTLKLIILNISYLISPNILYTDMSSNNLLNQDKVIQKIGQIPLRLTEFIQRMQLPMFSLWIIQTNKKILKTSIPLTNFLYRSLTCIDLLCYWFPMHRQVHIHHHLTIIPCLVPPQPLHFNDQ